jgi:hypothetical protein
MYNIQAAGAAG